MAAPHLPFQDVDHIRKAGYGYDWIPIIYSNHKTSEESTP